MKKCIEEFHWGLLSKYRTKLMGIAIIWIMLYHGNEIGMILPEPLEIINFVLEKGRGGVEIFLFLSGLGLYYSYSKNPDMKRFYRRRIVRVIFPYLLISLPFWIGQDLLIYRSFSAFVKNITLISFWVEGYTRLWYFGLLIPLYLVFPFIYKWIFGNGRQENSEIRRAWITIGLVVIFNISIKLIFPDYYSKVEIALTRIPIFIIGVLCGYFAKFNKKVTYGEIAALFLGYSYRMFTYEYHIGGMTVRYWYCALTLVVCFICIFFFEYIEKNQKQHRSGSSNILQIAGRYSLELYIVHIWIRTFFRKCGFDYNINGIQLNKYGLLNYFIIIIISCMVTYIFVKVQSIIRRVVKGFHI